MTIVERDILPIVPEHRRGVPQSRHTHALLASGVRLLEELLPGLYAEMVAAGAHKGDLLGNIRWLFSGRRLGQADIGQPMLCLRPAPAGGSGTGPGPRAAGGGVRRRAGRGRSDHLGGPAAGDRGAGRRGGQRRACHRGGPGRGFDRSRVPLPR